MTNQVRINGVRENSMSDAPPQMRDFGPRPELAWLPTQMLSVDPSYQRTLNSRASQNSIARITEKFRWSCFGAILVTAAGDGWNIIDGQHRAEAARRLQIATVPCIVVPATPAAEQAAIFLETNRNRVPVNPYALFHARIAAGEDLALQTQKLLEEAGLSVPRYPLPKSELKAGQIIAFKTVEVATQSTAARQAVVAVGRALASKPGAISVVVLRAAIAAAEKNPNAIGAIQTWLAAKDPTAINSRYFGQSGVLELTDALLRAASAPSPGVHSGSIAAPTRAQLMGGR